MARSLTIWIAATLAAWLLRCGLLPPLTLIRAQVLLQFLNLPIIYSISY